MLPLSLRLSPKTMTLLKSAAAAAVLNSMAVAMAPARWRVRSMEVLLGRDGLVRCGLRYGIPYGTACCSASPPQADGGRRSALAGARERVGEGVAGGRGRGLGCAAPRTRAAAVARAATGIAAGARTAAARLPRFVVQAHAEADALARKVHLHHLDLDDVAGLHRVARVLHEAVRQRRDRRQAVLVHADVDEGTECGDVDDAAFQEPAGRPILHTPTCLC